MILLLASIAGPSRAGVPDPRNSVVDRVIVGTASGTAVLMTGAVTPGFHVLVRDVNNTPLLGRAVALDFSAVGSIRGLSIQNPGTTVNCVARTLARVTDASGSAVFAPRFGGWSNPNAIEVSADGVVLAYASARSTDMAGDDGRTGLADFALFAQRYLPCPLCPPCALCPEADFDVSDGELNLNDFAIFGREFLLGVPAGTYCW